MHADGPRGRATTHRRAGGERTHERRRILRKLRSRPGGRRPVLPGVRDSRFCRRGAPATGARQPVDVTLGRSSNPYACPRCQEVDTTRKVTSIVNDATALGSIGGSYRGVGYQFGSYGGPTVYAGVLSATAASQTSIGRARSPPARPLLRSAWGAGPVIGLIAVLIFGLAAMGSGNGDIIVGLVVLAGAVGLIISTNKRGKEYQDAYAREMPRWESAMRNWDQLYYCMRCDGIYYPGRPEIYRSHETVHVVYQP